MFTGRGLTGLPTVAEIFHILFGWQLHGYIYLSKFTELDLYILLFKFYPNSKVYCIA